MFNKKDSDTKVSTNDRGETVVEVPEEKDRARFWIPIIVVVVLVIVGVGFLSMGSANGAEKDDAAEQSGEESADKKKEDEAKEEEKAPIPVNIATIGTSAISSYVTSTANLVAEDQVQVISEVEGRIATLHVEEGMMVDRGSVLVTFVKDDAEIAVRRAEVQANNAEVEFNRLKRLSDQELISLGEFDKAAMNRDVAKQNLEEVQWRLTKTVIRSPFRGVVSRRDVTVGKHVRPGDSLFTITDFEPLIADIFLPEREVMSLAVGRDVKITSKADDEIAFRGRIRQISPVVDTATGTVKVTIEAIDAPSSVRPGAFVQIDIVRETHEGAVVILRESVVRELQKAHVFVAEGKNAVKKAVKKTVELGMEEGIYIEVLSGVEAGEQIVVAGQGGLKDNALIKVIEKNEEKGN